MRRRLCFLLVHETATAIAILALAAAGSAIWLFRLTHDFPDPSGANGYFYLKQTESLAAGLGYYFKDRSLAFLLPVVIMKICGSALLSFQISISLVWAGLLFATGLLIWRLTEGARALPRLLLLAVSMLALAFTTPLYELALTFFKNAFAMMMAMASLACVMQIRSPWRAFAWRVVGAVLFGFLALLSHKSMLLVLLCFAVPWFVVRASMRQRLIGVAIAFALVGLFAWHFENGREYLLAISHSLTGPRPWWFWFSTLRWINLEMFTSIIAAFTIGAAAMLIRRRVDSRRRIFIDGSCLFIAVALQPFQLPGADGPAYRMILLTPLLAIPLFALVLTHLPRLARPFVIVLLLFVAQPWMHSKHLDDVFTPWSLLHDDVMRLHEFVRPEDHLTSHHGMEFFIDEATGIRSRSFLSDHPVQRSFRVAFVAERWIRDRKVQAAIHEKSLLDIGSEYVLVTETDWQMLTQEFHIPRHWKNPDTHRPAFIYE